jgi:hypothetical protein
MAVVATVSALVLGLLISNANTSFATLGREVTGLSAQILRLNQILRRYGPETIPARETLRRYAELKTTDLFPDNPADVRLGDQSTYELLQRLEDSLLALKPANARDQWWLGQAMTLAGNIGDTRWLLAQQVGQGTPKAFIALLVFWLTLLFASFGLFAPRNFISAVTLTLCALAVAGAVEMILELEKGLGGEGVRRTGPYLGSTDAPGGQGIASTDERMRRCARHHRPRRRAPEPRDERPPFHWITSSAVASSVSGMVRPSALAVFMLMTSSNLVGNMTGRSAGFSPLRIRLAY